jgi:hypothetical protein
MSSNLLPYKFKSKQWQKVEGINESDVAVIVDPTRNLIWYFEGKKSSARKRNKARNSLGQLKNQHATYKFKKINRMAPRDIIREVAILKEDFFIDNIKSLNVDVSKVSKAYFYLNCLGGLFNIINFVVSLLFVVGPGTVIFNDQIHYSFIISNFQIYLILQSILSLSSFILFTTTAIISLLFKQRIPAVYNILGSILIFIAFLMLIFSNSLMFSNVVFQQIFIRADVFILFNLNIEMLYLIGLFIAFIMGITAFRYIDQIIKDAD